MQVTSSFRPAQQLDPDLGLSTFQLGDFSFGGQLFAVPAGLKSYQTRIDARSTTGVYVDVSAAFNEQTGLVTWTFTSIDPTTFDVPAGNPEEGFLPPDDTSDSGVGFVTYIVAPKSTDTTATVIDAKATITFQAGLPDQSSLDTAPISNSIDAGAPSSAATALPTSSPLTFTVLWAGYDDAGGSGIASFDIYVSDNGGPFTVWLTGTTADLSHVHGEGRPYLRLLQRGDLRRRSCTGDAGHRQGNHHGQSRGNDPRGGLGQAPRWDRHADGHLDCGGVPLAGRGRRSFTPTAGGITTSVRYRDDRQQRRRDPSAREPCRPTRRHRRRRGGG